METDKNEPIVPHKEWANTPTYGLTKREYFAAKAMQGLCSDHEYKISDIAASAVKIADALINELNKDNGTV